VYTLGREPACDIYLPGLKISNEHCILSWNGKEDNDAVISIQDTSCNGIWINGRRIDPSPSAHILRDGNEVAFSTPLPEQDPGEDYRYIFRMLVGDMVTVGLNAHYDLVHELGHGSFATVMKAHRRDTGTWCAVKIIHRTTKDELVSLMREIAILRSLEHDNICALRECFFPDSDAHLVLELVEGGDLLDYIWEGNGLCEYLAQDIAKQVCSAVAYMHGRRVVHRDLKPENILLSKDKAIAKVADFGIAKFLDDTAQMPRVCGTPTYLAPEVFSGGVPGYDHLVDSWSLGVIVFCMLANCTPFIEDESLPIARRIVHRKVDWKRLDRGNHEVSPLDFVARLLVSNPRTRMTAAEALNHPWL
ncbi:kinase-like protein, partial [Peniophora sp. CONT]